MQQVSISAATLAVALALSLMLWAIVGYAVGIHPVHLGLRHDAHVIERTMRLPRITPGSFRWE